MTCEQFGTYSIGLTLVESQKIADSTFKFTMKGKEKIVHRKKVRFMAVGSLNYVLNTFRHEECCEIEIKKAQ